MTSYANQTLLRNSAVTSMCSCNQRPFNHFSGLGANLFYNLQITVTNENVSRQNPLVGIKDLPVIGTGRFDSQFLDLVSDLLNFTSVDTTYIWLHFLINFVNRYDIRPPKDVLASGNLLRNGSWTGGLGQLQRKVFHSTVSIEKKFYTNFNKLKKI